MAFEQHFEDVAKAVRRGKVVLFLGAGVNLCNRPTGVTWALGSKDLLPSGGELAEALADELHRPERVICPNPICQWPQPERDLLKVSQEIVNFMGDGELRDTLHSVFEAQAPLTPVHNFIATLAPATRPNRDEDRYPLVVTTNYDDMMERAYRQIPLSYDMVFYGPNRVARGSFYHLQSGAAEPLEIDTPNTYLHAFCKDQATILKIHGSIDRTSPKLDARFVITEDHYIDYLAQGALENLLPATLLAKLQNHYLLFLGYSLRDWNLRVFLRKLRNWNSFRSWAVLPHAHDAESKFWERNGVDIVPMDLKEYVGRLGRQLTVHTPDASP